MTAKIVLAANTAWYLVNFRLNLAQALQQAGFEVVAVAPPAQCSSQIEAAGVRFVPMPLDRKGNNPLRDFSYFIRMLDLLRREQPSFFLGWTIKPNIYGGFACRLLRIPSIHNISGLGTAFTRESWVTRIAKILYRQSLKRAKVVFFQNPDDLDQFLGLGLVRSKQARRLPGSGVDIVRFLPQPLIKMDRERPFRFLLIARILWDKGIGEYVEAARRLKAEGRDVECQMLGFLGDDNVTAVSSDQVADWERAGLIRFLGPKEDVRPQIAEADCVVLPSYREGTPRSLLEAAAMARPIITTDVVGCREVVDDGETGFLCRARDAIDLTEKMGRMMDISQESRATMGERGRVKIELQFDERIVIERYLDAVESGRPPRDLAIQ